MALMMAVEQATELLSVFGRFWTRDELRLELEVLEEMAGALSDRAWELDKQGLGSLADVIRGRGREMEKKARHCKAVLRQGAARTTGSSEVHVTTGGEISHG